MRNVTLVSCFLSTAPEKLHFIPEYSVIPLLRIPNAVLCTSIKMRNDDSFFYDDYDDGECVIYKIKIVFILCQTVRNNIGNMTVRTLSAMLRCIIFAYSIYNIIYIYIYIYVAAVIHYIYIYIYRWRYFF